MSVFFYQQILQYLSKNLIKKRLGGPQKMPSKVCKLCNVSNLQLKTQLFRERLSGKVHATILKGIVGGFEFRLIL